MKSAMLFLVFPLMLFASCIKEKLLNYDDLPDFCVSYIATHFPGLPLTHAIKEFDDLQIKYTVYLKNGVKIEFNQNGEINKIEGNVELPDSVIPAAILDYVKSKFPSSYIKKWEAERALQAVTLSNGLTLEFDKKGLFLRSTGVLQLTNKFSLYD